MRAIDTKCVLSCYFASFASYFNLFSISLSCCPLCYLAFHYELYTECCSAAERAPFPHRWLFGELENWMLLSCFFLLAIVGAEVVENYIQRPNRSLLSKALHMHLSELNTYELCTGVGDISTVKEADGGGGATERDTQVWMHQTWARCWDAHTQEIAAAKLRCCTHVHAPPLEANAIKGGITAKSIRRNLREMKWSKSKMKRRDEMAWKRGGRLGFTQA